MSMQRIIIVMLLFFLSEGTIFYWLIPGDLVGRIIPHFTLAFVLFAALYRGRHASLLLGLSFGLLQDLAFYGRIIGVHSFSMGLVGYMTGLLLERKRSTLLMALSMIGLSTLVYDTVVYFIYKVFRLTDLTYEYSLYQHIIPSLFLQLLFALALYIPARRWFEGSLKPKTEEEEV
ncbi:rod shape-determining protein MreD [Paenibacillus sacheonensis]|uniref:Rod shape-determining protein MreD n=1 Tax=Paenibacillus sacheonensis TaxID=742054 RepID=A0A7X4YKA7_9BACL|nr:rod shape-determining protein MreD [Paenibacillus sacheonensis]MBM7563775.1 rod shape-determining protein MreD [Paenibacillus sacheonensis]NBC67873.1 rod shape-determining protein MreD [Paenibacillus sacheonensis]